MRVLLVDGFVVHDHPAVDASHRHLDGRGHAVTRLHLLDEGFGTFMSATERAAYHEPDNLVAPETRRSAALLRSSDALLVCAPLVEGAIAAPVKSWFERVFVPGVSFTFTNRGRVTAALTNIARVGMVVVCADDDRAPHRRNGSTRSVLRGVRLNAARLCRTSYGVVGPADDETRVVARTLSRW